jgi:putative phosphoribosyl transferase
VRRLLPSEIIVAAPVGAADSCRALQEVADDVVCARMPDPLRAVGLWYQNFEQTTDEEVRALLAAAAGDPAMKRSA